MISRELKLSTIFVVAAILATSAAAGDAEPVGNPQPADMRARMARVVDPAAYYPPGAKSRGERGSPVVQACVGADGKLSREPVITETSGFPELDAAAVKVAKANRYKPGTENGMPLSESCIKYRVKFG